MAGHHKNVEQRRCSLCGSRHTCIHPKGYPHWYFADNEPIIGGGLVYSCAKCYLKEYRRDKKVHPWDDGLLIFGELI